MSKITLTTVKSFIKKAGDNLLVSTRSQFDGMVDGCVSSGDKSFAPAQKTDNPHSNNFGLCGIWFVFGSRDYFDAYEDEQVRGIKVYNSCGSFILAVAK